MTYKMKVAVFFTTLITVTLASRTCTITVDYVLCNGVNFNVLRAGEYPVNTTTIHAFHLNSNNLSRLEEDVFSSIPRLKFIVITHNLIQTLDTGLFWNLKDLVHLDLTDNRIKSITSSIFISQTKLKNLLLGYNDIETLDSRVLIPLDSLSSLDLTHNPFVCNCELRGVINWCQKRKLAGNTTCNDGTFWSTLNITGICENAELYTTIASSASTNISTEIPSENLTKYKETRPFNTQEIITVVSIIIVLIACIIIGLYFWKRSQMFCFKENDRARHIGRTEIEDCRNEFVSSKRHHYLRESLSDSTSYEHEDFKMLDSTPECEVLRRPSESDSVYSNPSKLIEREDVIPELPDLAVAYAEPFHRSDSPGPVYAVPFNGEKELWIQNNMYAVPEVNDEKVNYSKGKQKN